MTKQVRDLRLCRIPPTRSDSDRPRCGGNRRPGLRGLGPLPRL